MATLSGVYSEDGVLKSGALVCCYDYGSRNIANLTALVDSTTTDVNGEWALTTANTNLHLVKIASPSDVKRGTVYLEYPS